MGDKRTGSIVSGVVVIAIGLIFFGERLHVFGGWTFQQLWPLLVIAFGLVQLFEPGRPDGRGRGSLFVISVGVLLLLHTLHVLSLETSWPLMVVAWGVSMLFGARRKAVSARTESDHVD